MKQHSSRHQRSARRHHDAYGRTLLVCLFVSGAILATLLVNAPRPPIHAYQLHTEATRYAHEPEMVILPSNVVVEARTEAYGPCAELEWNPQRAFLLVHAAQTPPPRWLSQRHVFDFEPMPTQSLPPQPEQAMFRMHPQNETTLARVDLDRFVLVKVKVDARGAVVDARVEKGIEYTLDQQALQAAWSYRHANADAAETWVTLPYEFLALR